jgi:hypothetical protein
MPNTIEEQAAALARLLRRSEAAEYIRDRWGYPCSRATLAKLAVVGGGPVFRRAGRFPMYDRADLDDWVRRKLSVPVGSTSELAGAGVPPAFDVAETPVEACDREDRMKRHNHDPEPAAPPTADARSVKPQRRRRRANTEQATREA